MIDEAFLAGWVERLRREIPGAIAVVLKGSHVRGNAGLHSDLDLDVLVFDEEIADAYLTWIVDDGSGRLVHVSVAVESLEDWLAGFRDVASWSFGFPSSEVTRLMWLGRPSLRAELDRPGREHRGGEPELEDFIEELGKARDARLRGDDISLRLAVQEIAQLCPTLLVPLNAPAKTGTRPEALRAALDLAVAARSKCGRDLSTPCPTLAGPVDFRAAPALPGAGERRAARERRATMSIGTSTAAVSELVTMFDHVLEEHGFGWDHWHSLLWNLHNVEPEQWTQLPPGGGRTIRELVIHLGGTFLMYESHAFGDGSRDWSDRAIDGVGPGDTPEETTAWLRRAHAVLRDSAARLTDDQLGELRKAPWGEEYEARRIIELMIQHPIYHVGEINHIRALLQGNDDWDHQDLGREEQA